MGEAVVQGAGPYLAQTAIRRPRLERPRVVALRCPRAIQLLGDSLWFALLAKSVAHNGWAFFVPQLSAPYGLAAAAFPTMTNFDWLIMKVIALVLKDPASCSTSSGCARFFSPRGPACSRCVSSGCRAGSPPSAASFTGVFPTRGCGAPATSVSCSIPFPLCAIRRVPGSRARRPLERRHLSARGTACGVHPGIPVPVFQLVRDRAVRRRGAPRLGSSESVKLLSGPLSASWF